EWRPAEAPLMTRWAADVSPENALVEYPRPQMVRERWQSLNGLWQFGVAEEGEAAPIGRELPRRILVPYPVESALSGVGEHHDRLWYRRTFRVPAAWKGERVLLHFGAVDWLAEVWVNGTRLGEHRGGYDAFSFDVTAALLSGAEQELVVGVWDPTDAGNQPRGKQVEKPRSIWYSPVTGIWQTVWLEPVPAARVERLRLAPDVPAGALRLTAVTEGARPGDVVRAVALSARREVGRVEGAPGAELRLPVPDARLWSPDDPFLYDLRVLLLRDGRSTDSVGSYFGMRQVALGQDSAGATRILLNGEPVFQVGLLDQGWWPDGLYTAPTDEALRYDLEITKRLGFNMTRKHVKVEPARWYYWADRLGLLVWQDMPNGRSAPEARPQFETELREMITELRNHPSIVLWVPFNEGWGQYDTHRIAGWVKEQDPTRLVIDASGWRHEDAGDVRDVHRYHGPQAMRPARGKAAVVGEFGGLGRVTPGHTWTDEGWGYGRTNLSAAELADRYDQLLGRMWRLRDTHGMSAGVYTQLTDVEREMNGLLTYDRAVLKIDTARLAAVNRGTTPLVLPEMREFTDSARVEIVQGRPTELRYSLDGSDPGPASRRYTGPFTLRTDADLRVRAYDGGTPVGPVVTARFRKVAGRAPVTVKGAVPGVEYAYYEDEAVRPLRRSVEPDPAPDPLQPVATGVLPDLSLRPAQREEKWTIQYRGYLRVPRNGVYTLTTESEDGVKLWVGDQVLIEAISYSPAVVENTGSVALQAGLHPFILGFLKMHGPAVLDVYIEGPGLPRQRLSGEMLFRAPDGRAGGAW
ncbi:MAG: chitobiase/beta-hexosaminidase C-terminal domain-containing protein, partial [Gemmatimonadetes bacterium]|nr:chitobiase/beta-hexosaminidase C-terminal domain-containing protein [Gemmatimonadota bacterium]